MAFIKVEENSRYIDDMFFDISKKNAIEISGLQTIKESIENIILTSPGELLFEPSFGSGIIKYLFGNFNTNTRLIENVVIKAIEDWEPRIFIVREDSFINIDVDNHSISLNLSYIIKSNGQVDTYKKIIGV